MSSILKALKKQEKDRSICKPNQFKIDERILQNSSSGSLSRTAVSGIALALFACGSGATYVYLKHEPVVAVVAQSSSAQTGADIHPLNSAVIPTELKNGMNHTTSAEPQVIQKPTAGSGGNEGLPSTAASISTPIQPAKLSERAPASDSKPAPAVSSPTRSVASRPNLTVNGIAFQEGGSDNLAVINGVTVSSGTMIDGVVVEEIQKDRVRFSHNGERFEIILNKTSR